MTLAAGWGGYFISGLFSDKDNFLEQFCFFFFKTWEK